MNGFRRRRGEGMLLAALLLLGSGSLGRVGATYYPYPMYEEYWADQPHPERGGNGEAPAPAPAAKGAPGAKAPSAWQRVPGFLFPKELGYGVAIGVPYDMFYLSGSYYLLEGERWSRAPSHRGPWRPVPRTKLPQILLKHDLAEIRQLRNREFREYWEKGERYKGKHFRPGGKTKGKRPN